MQEMTGKENLPCDGHPRGPRCRPGGQPDRHCAAGSPEKGESPAWGKRGSLMGVKLGDFKEVDASGRKTVQRGNGASCGIFAGASGLPQDPLLAFWASMGS